jgi:hypothetical protein
MERGQATIEYTGLAFLICVGACVLVAFHTPVMKLAREIADALDGRPPKPKITGRPHPHRGPSRTIERPCLCPFGDPAKAERFAPQKIGETIHAWPPPPER